MKDLVKLPDGTYGLNEMFVTSILTIEKEIKGLKEMQDTYKEALLKIMEENNILKIEQGKLVVTRKAPTTRETLDSKSLKADMPDIYDEYVKITDVKGSITLKIKEEE